jgi:hypothetical protein
MLATGHRRRGLGALALVWIFGCEPTFDRPPTLIEAPAVLAVRSDPAEAAPGATVTLRASLAGQTGPIDDAAADWAFCTRARDVAENTPVAQDCLEETAAWIVPIAAGATGAVTATLPPDGCANFGSEPPPPPAGQDPIRPADPDATGGYYQPVRVTVRGPEPLVAFGRVRISCALPSAPADIVREFRERYVANRNPGLVDLRAVEERGREVRLRAEWGVADAETFVVHDRREAELDEAVESLRVSWFSTSGAFATDRTSADGSSPASENVLFLQGPGSVHVWAVVRDPRGGMDWRSLVVEVR